MPWSMFHRVERRARCMHAMMRRLDVDPVKLARLRGGDAYAEARSRCLGCAASERCLLWLDTPAEIGRRPGQRPGQRPVFCPNLALFESCRRERAAP